MHYYERCHREIKEINTKIKYINKRLNRYYILRIKKTEGEKLYKTLNKIKELKDEISSLEERKEHLEDEIMEQGRNYSNYFTPLAELDLIRIINNDGFILGTLNF